MNEAGAETRLDVPEPTGHPFGFYIPTTSSLPKQRPRTLKHGDTFAVFDQYGDIVPGEDGPAGLFHNDMRFLSRLQVLVNGRRPLLLSSTVQDNNAVLTADLTNPDLFADGQLTLERDTLHIFRAKFLWRGACYERFAVRNFDARPHVLRLGLVIESDFADLFEVRGHKRVRRGRKSAKTVAPDTVVLRYLGLDRVARRTTLRFEPLPTVLEKKRVVFDLRLAPGERMSVFMTVSCTEEREAPSRGRFFVCLRTARKALRESTARAASTETSNQIFNEVLCRSMADLYMLVTDTEHGPYPYAGIPWYSTAFGRDGIITAAQMLWVDPGLAKGVLGFLAATQAAVEDPGADAEPGKILHETRRGEMAHLGEVPFGRYYGSVDSTPLFVMLAGMYFERTGDIATIEALWPHVVAALEWIDEYGDRDGDGFVEYCRKSEWGLDNQGWKDSHDSVFHADGRRAEGPIALCEVQGYVYAAKRYAAEIARRVGSAALAATLERQAACLKENFEDSFWCEDIGTYALALDGDKRPCRVRSSNAGQVLFSGIADPERAARTADLLLGQSFFCGWGIRTIAASEARYNPMSYHNGSVWPHDNALIALGMARYGLTGHVQQLFGALFDAASYMDLRRLPELFCGFRRQPGKGPTVYPVACSPQGWASATPFALLQACLGLSFDHRAQEVRLRRPRLPDFLDEVVIRSLTLGDTRMNLALRGHGSNFSANVIDKTGDGTVVITL
ncbi:MAG: glycogen debranching N-terminal domain-containing protein [Alphaproteobacteria bacterium]